MKNHFLLGLSIATLALSSCSQNDETKAAPAQLVPQSLAEYAPTITTPLTRSQVQATKSVFAIKAKMKVPDSELVFPDRSRSQERRAAIENRLKQEDPNSFALLQDIRSEKCQKKRRTAEINTRFPIDDVTRLSELQPGDRYGVTFEGGIGNSGNEVCAVKLDGKYSHEGKILSADDAQKSIEARTETAVDFAAVSQNARNSRLLGQRGYVLSARETSVAAIKSTSGEALFTVSVSGKFLAIDQDIPVSMVTQVLTKATSDKWLNEKSNLSVEQVRVQFAQRTIIDMGDFKIEVIMKGFSDSNGKRQSDSDLQLIVNGQKMTEESLNDLLGENSLAGSLDQQVLQLL